MVALAFRLDNLHLFGKLLLCGYGWFNHICSAHNKLTKLFHFFLLDDMFRALIYTTNFIIFVMEHSFILVFNLMYDIGIILFMYFTIIVL